MEAGDVPKKISSIWSMIMKKIHKKFGSNYYKLMNMFPRQNFALFCILMSEKIFYLLLQ